MPENNLDKPPLFAVGEEVLLCSKDYPELNGDCTVVDVFYYPPLKRYGYITTIPLYPPKKFWAQSALRKKHKPSEHSFDSLMAGLKSKQPKHA